MGKILNLKRWLTIPEAAKHLSLAFSEEVTDADVLYLALDQHLQLSVEFINGAMGRPGKIIPISEAPTYIGPISGVERKMGIKLNDDTVILLEDKVMSLAGIWDLPMIGGERIDVEYLYQQKIFGPEVGTVALDGAFVKNGEVIVQIQADYDDNEYSVGSKGDLEEIRRRIANESIDAERAEQLISQHAIDRKKFLEDHKSQKAIDRYYPAGGLPPDATYVVRAAALRQFEQSVENGQDALPEKLLTVTERNSFLKLLVGMAIKGYAYDPSAKRSTAPKEIETDLAQLGLQITDDTIRKYLKEAVESVLPRTAKSD